MDLALENKAVDTEEMSKRIYCDGRGWDDAVRWCQWRREKEEWSEEFKSIRVGF